MVKCQSCSKYSSGMLNATVAIQRKSRLADGMGGYVDAWTTIATPFAMFTPMSGGQLFAAQRINPRLSVKLVIRFKGDSFDAPYYTAADQIIYRNRTYAISSVIDVDNEQQWIEMMLEEGVSS